MPTDRREGHGKPHSVIAKRLGHQSRGDKERMLYASRRRALAYGSGALPGRLLLGGIGAALASGIR